MSTIINDHADAMIALLEADNVNPALMVFKGPAPQNTLPPYVCVYFADYDPQDADSTPLNGTSSRFVIRAYAHCVGGNETAAFAVAQRVRDAWLHARPAIGGRACMRIRREDGQPVQRDETTGLLVQDKLDVYRLESEPG